MESMRIWRGLAEALGEEVGFRQCGVVYCGESASDLAGYEAWLPHAQAYQLDTRMLTGEEVADLLPDSGQRFLGALYTASDGRAEPAKAAPALARAAARLGASLHTDCAVRGFETEGGRLSHAITERGPIRTQALILAGGVWSRLFCGNQGLDFPQLSQRGSVQRLAPGPEVGETSLWTPGFTLRRRLDGGYTVTHGRGTVADLTPEHFRQLKRFWPAYLQERKRIRLSFGRPFFEALGRRKRWRLDEASPFEAARILDPAPDHAILDLALANLRRAFPAFAGVPVAERWAGMIDVSPDLVPVIGPLEARPGFFLASGFSGHGFGIGPGAGKLMAELVAGDTPCVDPEPFRFARFQEDARPLGDV